MKITLKNFNDKIISLHNECIESSEIAKRLGIGESYISIVLTDYHNSKKTSLDNKIESIALDESNKNDTLGFSTIEKAKELSRAFHAENEKVKRYPNDCVLKRKVKRLGELLAAIKPEQNRKPVKRNVYDNLRKQELVDREFQLI